MYNHTLEYINTVLPFQKPVSLKRQGEILGVPADKSNIANKILDTHREDVLVCLQSGREVPLVDDLQPDTLITVQSLIDPRLWRSNVIFPVSGPRKTVISKLSTLALTKI